MLKLVNDSPLLVRHRLFEIKVYQDADKINVLQSEVFIDI